ncbi:sulfite exporter TauE/SafE family protein [Pseudomonas sp. R5(2019)]|uniref:sulfite exporter TauE/SafE family protein n=1 Tax=Pseudomonas sp. R5(2019) TaxID=2697566 RepID=UPI001412C730|nr:sulfite exporter TauE/SafE family protein [Pseudomonas sp. R5(2019)]NBA98102.1 TSUP family transporter [Pseudomonas sp. R5(2019)]
MLNHLVGITPAQLAYVLTCIFLAAIARGFSGFGFTLLTVMSLSFVLPPAVTVPAMFVMEIAAGIKLLPAIYRQVHWRSIRVLVVTSIATTPLGAWLLASLPTEQVKLMLAIMVSLTCLALLCGFKLQRMPSVLSTAATGAGAGVLNGSLGLGGPPVIVLFLGSPLALEAGRASIIAAFLAMDLAALPALWALGMFTQQAIVLGLLSLPALVMGVMLGARLTGRIDEAEARTLMLLMMLAMAACTFAELFA